VQYMLLIYSNENGASDGDEGIIKRYGDFTEEVRDGGKLVTADRLQPVSAATTVRIRNGETLVTDGPFAETKEQLGGYYRPRVREHRRGAAVRREDPDGRVRVDRGASGLGDVGTVEAVFRAEYGRVVATLIRDLRDIDLAEDALQDALATALVAWPRAGVPRAPARGSRSLRGARRSTACAASGAWPSSSPNWSSRRRKRWTKRRSRTSGFR
jgi:Uncharacterized protein conserved in bacteria